MKQSILKKKIIKIFENHNLISSHALICADALINAELVGAPSHGLSRLKMYCDRINKKVINPKIIPKYNGAKEKLVMPLINSKVGPSDENIGNLDFPAGLLSKTYSTKACLKPTQTDNPLT